MPNPQILYFLRHGSTRFDNAKKELTQGWLKEGLDEQGLKEAHAAAERIKKGGYAIDKLVCSDLPRAAETAEIVGKAIGLVPIHTPSLRCQDIGVLAGQPEEAVNSVLAELALKHPDFKIPNGESSNDFWPAITRLIVRQWENGVTYLNVTHSTDIYVAMAMRGKDLVNKELMAHPKMDLNPCALVAVFKRQGKWRSSVVDKGGSKA
jgi:probable phosphoglycerate mutase